MKKFNDEDVIQYVEFFDNIDPRVKLIIDSIVKYTAFFTVIPLTIFLKIGTETKKEM